MRQRIDASPPALLLWRHVKIWQDLSRGAGPPSVEETRRREDEEGETVNKQLNAALAHRGWGCLLWVSESAAGFCTPARWSSPSPERWCHSSAPSRGWCPAPRPEPAPAASAGRQKTQNTTDKTCSAKQCLHKVAVCFYIWSRLKEIK